MLLVYVASTGSLWDGFWLMGVNGIGRALPLIFLSVLGILGVNALPVLLKRKITVDKIVGWSLVALASFITLNGLFSHFWYEASFFHEGLNMLAERIGGERLAEAAIEMEEEKILLMEWAPWANLVLMLGTLFWFWWKNGKQFSKELLVVLVIFTLWGLAVMPLGVKAM